MLIDATYFIGEINVPNIDTPGGVVENLNFFISKYEDRFLTILLGESVKDLFVAEMAKPEEDQAQIWKDLKAKLVNEEKKQSPIANYVYKFYSDDKVSHTAGTGEVKSKNENSTPVTSIRKVVRAWNEMSDWVGDTIPFFNELYAVNAFEGYYFHNRWCNPNRFEFNKMNILNF